MVYEQQPGESPTHYAWFHAYLMMGPRRSLLGAYKKFYEGSQKVAKSLNISPSWRKASGEWNWRGRAGVWDKERRLNREIKTREQAEKVVDRVLLVVEKHIERAEQADNTARQILNFPLLQQTIENGGNTTIINPGRWNVATGIRALVASGTAMKTAIETLQLLGVLEAENAQKEAAQGAEFSEAQARLVLEARGYTVTEPLGEVVSPRDVENELLAHMELTARQQMASGQKGATERLLRISTARARLNGLNKPFDPRDESRPKRRRDMSGFSDAALEIFEELLPEEMEE